jgi:regulation of enolase protein 1 (concanavalin A-like superfamily)
VFVAAPEWVRLVRRGDSVSAYTSPDGAAWSLIASDTIQLPAAVYVGLAVTSHNVSGATTASLSQVAVSPLGLPAGQQDGDIGSPSVAGSAVYADGSYQIHAGGTDIWGTADQFHYVYQQVTGDVDVSVRIVDMTYVDQWSKAGVMIRETLSDGSAHGMALVSAGRGYAFQRRPVAGGSSVNTAGSQGVPPGWLRLTRSGDLVTAYQSADGQSWTPIGSDSIPMADTVFVGIAVTSHTPSAATDVTADHLSVTQTQPPTNQPPAVSIASPANGATFTAPTSITINATAADPENQLTKVEFYNGTTLLGTATAAPYSFAWTSVPAGTYSLTAVAYDAGGLTAQSVAVSVVVNPPPDPPPTGVSFIASTDHASVTSYRVDVFAAGADPDTATPVATLDAGKPTPDVDDGITVSAPSFFSALAPGSYELTVTAISPDGSGRSQPVAFVR